MKIRFGFVSNSSSASFVIPKSRLTEEQIRKLLDFGGDGWGIYEDGDDIRGSTSCDNGELGEFLYEIGVNNARIEDWS